MKKKPAAFSTKIDISLAGKLREDLEAQGFKMTKPLYTIFSAQKKGLVLALYESGSLVVQGKNKDEFIEFYLEPEILQNFAYTHPQMRLNLTPHIGVDEAGKGDFFGPLCIAGVYADEETIQQIFTLGVKDSKRLSDKTVLDLAGELKKICQYSVIRLFPEKYNQLYLQFKNLNQLLAWGHSAVIGDLFEKTGCKEVIVDQFAKEHVLQNMIKKKKLDIHLVQRTKGEEDTVVAAASIFARASFLLGLQQLSKEHQCEFPKGASALVIEAGKKFTKEHACDDLAKVAKIHFKTTAEISALGKKPAD